MNEKTVLITGASSGIGKASALLFLQNNYKVYATAPTTENMIDLEKKGARILQLDITNSDNCRQIADLIHQESGNLDVLINNAGFGLYGALEDVPLAEGRHQFEVNLFGIVELTQLFLPSMRANEKGRIINISSILGRTSLPLGGWYHASKYALEGISESLRQEVSQFGIDVILINPGAIKSEWAGIALSNANKYSANTIYNQQLEQVQNLFLQSKSVEITAEQVAHAILTASESAKPKVRYIVGQHAKLFWLINGLLNERFFNYCKNKWIQNKKNSKLS